jgi:O-antigen ligase
VLKHSTRNAVISFVLCAYAVFSLSSMAGMNISFLFVALTFCYLLFCSSFRLPDSLIKLPDFKRYLIYGGSLFAACLLSLIVAKFHPIIYADHAPDITAHGFLKIWYLFCPLILATVFLSREDSNPLLEKVKNYWWIATLILAGVALIQFFTGWPEAQAIPTNPGRYHAILFFGHHLSTASIIIFPTFVALAQALGKKIRQNAWDKLAWATGLAGILILFLTYARAAWVSVPIGIALLFFRYLKPKTQVLGVVGLALFLALGSQTSLVKERIQNSMGVTDRIRLWEANIDYFKHNPITGIGWLKTQEMSEFYFKQKDPAHYHDYFWGHAHSNFFEMLGGTGLVGLLAFLAWSCFTLSLAYTASRPLEIEKNPSLADFAYGLGVALVLLHLNGLTNVTFWEGKVMHQQMFAVALLLVIRARQNLPRQEPRIRSSFPL